jgi:glycosyltransferase involved in cell wall biosynthesis
MNPPLLSVVIPAFNRLAPLRATLTAVQIAASNVPTEIVLVDDGSSPALSEQISSTGAASLRFYGQENSGPIAARLHGLREARGKYVLFLDSDDLVHPEKFSAAIEKLELEQADVVYDDMARASLNGAEWSFEPAEALRRATDSAEFFLKVQPAPHSPIFLRSYLLSHVEKPLFSPHRAFDPAGDVWLYYNLCIFPAKIVKLDRALTAVGVHTEDRYSRHWEKIAIASLAIMEAFAAHCPKDEDTEHARTIAGECAFDSWRRLPRGFHSDFQKRFLRLWKNASHGPMENLGGPFFQKLAKLFGPIGAGRCLRLRNEPYRRVRTASDADFATWFALLQ